MKLISGYECCGEAWTGEIAFIDEAGDCPECGQLTDPKWSGLLWERGDLAMRDGKQVEIVGIVGMTATVDVPASYRTETDVRTLFPIPGSLPGPLDEPTYRRRQSS